MKRTTSTTTTRKPSRVVCYVRVSTEKQAQEGMSLEAQRSKLEAYASLYGLVIVGWFEDAGVSAKSLDRSGLQAALSALRFGQADALLVVKLDRLTRSVADLATLIETYFGDNGSALLSVSEQIDTRSASGRLVLNVLTSVGQWEREATGERTAAVLAHKASLGEYCGGQVPYGFTLSEDARNLLPLPTEQAVIRKAQALHRAEYKSAHIARIFARQGILSRTGRPFVAQQIERIIAA